MNAASAIAAFGAVAYISTNTYLTMTTPPTRKKTMTDQPATIGAPPTILDSLAQMLSELLATRIHCLGCTADAHRAIAAGQQPGNVNLANVVVSGNGQCWQHVQFVDRPLAPGQRPSGLLVPGQVG